MDNGATMKIPEIGDLVFLKYIHHTDKDSNIILFVTSVTNKPSPPSTFGFKLNGFVLYHNKGEGVNPYHTGYGFFAFDRYFIHNKKCGVDEILMLEEL